MNGWIDKSEVCYGSTVCREDAASSRAAENTESAG